MNIKINAFLLDITSNINALALPKFTRVFFMEPFIDNPEKVSPMVYDLITTFRYDK